MKMEKKFREALLKVLADKTFKNESALCEAAGVNQGGLNKYIRTVKFLAGESKEPAQIKENLNLDIVSKLVDAMGGELVFPWDSMKSCQENTNSEKTTMDSDETGEIARLQRELAQKQKAIETLTTEKETLRTVIRDITGRNMRFENDRQNKSCA